MNRDFDLIRNTDFIYNPAMEFLLAAAALEKLHSLESGELFVDGESMRIIHQMKCTYSEYMLSESKCFFGNLETCLPLFVYAIMHQAGKTPEGMIDQLTGQDGDSFYKMCRRIWQLTAGQGTNEAGTRIWAEPEDPAGEKRMRIITFLRLFYHMAYQQFEEQITQAGFEAQKAIRKEFTDDPGGFYQRCLRLESDNDMGTVQIHTSCFLQANMLILKPCTDWPATWIAVGSGCLYSNTNSMQGRDATEKFIQLLGDKTRFRILKLLNTRRWYNEELASAMNLSPSTINHHLAVLLEFKLVRMLREKHRMYYCVDHQVMAEYLQRLDKTFNTR